MVLTLHEGERAEAQRVLTNAQTTDGYVVGEADDAVIANLRAQGLILTEVAEAKRTRGPSKARGEGATLPGYYRASVAQPVVPAYHAALEAAGIELKEVRDDEYVFYIVDDAQLTALEHFPWIGDVRPFDAATTAAAMRAPTRGPGKPVVASRWDLVVHEGADTQALAAWCRGENVEVTKVTRTKVQIQASAAQAEACAARVEVASVMPWRAPALRVDRSRGLVGAATARTSKHELTGRGVIVGVADSGLDAAHDAFATKKPLVIAKGRVGDASDPHGHGTHVAGTICGDPAAHPELAGIAPAASLVFQSVMDAGGGLGGLGDDLLALLDEAYGHGVRIHNNSWGADVGGAYASSSLEIDRFVWEHPDMLVVIAAGNAGSVATPVDGPRHSPDGDVEWFSVGAPGTAKNALVVGASRSDRTIGGWSTLTYKDVWPQRFASPATMAEHTVSGDATALAAFSSRGLSDDQRIKPDLVAPGTDIAAPRASTAPAFHFAGSVPNTKRAYGYMSGTSMATPVVSGVAALLREYLVRVRGLATPSAALMKAILINGTRPLVGPGTQCETASVPNPHQGFGCIDLAASIPLDGAAFQLAFVDTWAQQRTPFLRKSPDTRRRYTFTTTAAGPLRITLAYTDYWARGVQNNLDIVLEIEKPPARHIGNVDLQTLLPTMKFPDPTNNVETIKIDHAPAATWTVIVFASNVNFDPQHFALAITGALSSDQLQEL